MAGIGVGIYRGGPDVWEALQQMQPPLVLAMDLDGAGWARLRALLPGALLIGRRFIRGQRFQPPEEQAERVADLIAAAHAAAGGVPDAWMSLNEAVGNGDLAGYEAYDRFESRVAERLAERGIRLVACNFGSGVVEPEDWPRYFRRTLERAAYLGVHAYPDDRGSSARRPSRMPLDGGDPSWSVLRYRRILAACDRAGVRCPPIAITELGMKEGWRGVVDEEEMLRQFTWYAGELARDGARVAGCAIYCCGTPDPERWWRFDIARSGLPAALGRLNRLSPLPTGERKAEEETGAETTPLLPETGRGEERGGTSVAELTEARRAVVRRAEALLGVPYQINLPGAANRGFGKKYPERDSGLDCSGLVCDCLRAGGVDLGDPDYLSAARIAALGEPIAAEQAQPGDVVFFQGTYDVGEHITHCGIVVAPGEMINAREPVVARDRIVGYWQEHLEGYRRYLPAAERYPVVMGFAALRARLGAAATGAPLEAEHADGQGNTWQEFERCTMRWEKATNRVWVSFKES